MTKIEVKPEIAPFPKPVTIIGSQVDGQPNFANIVWVNRMNRSPNILGVSINHKHHTLKGIKQTGTFSVNFPDTQLAEKTDYVGLVSGRDVDKSTIFDIFYGSLKTAPMIKECPIAVECSVHDMVELPDHAIVLGEVKQVYSEEQYLTDGSLDPKKFDPLIFTRPGPIGTYWSLGESIGRAWSIGKKLLEE
ncbi:MAG: flavin reductase family protein [Candidatus Thorarchaeota archaeon]|jgi:flavin reductase (DIM6/NTAB) family NADH-FMN oxidoreductase RutF